MILDAIGNIHRYMGLNRGFSKAVEFLSNPGLPELADGRYRIDGDRVYALVSRDKGRKKEDSYLEIHRRYIDLQLVLSGTDEMGWRPASTCTHLKTAYDEEKDIQFFLDSPNVWVPVQKSCFAVFFPEDAHMPLISEGTLHKTVVKIEAD